MPIYYVYLLEALCEALATRWRGGGSPGDPGDLCVDDEQTGMARHTHSSGTASKQASLSKRVATPHTEINTGLAKTV